MHVAVAEVQIMVDASSARVVKIANSDSIAFVHRTAFWCDRFRHASERAAKVVGRAVRTIDLVDLYVIDM